MPGSGRTPVRSQPGPGGKLSRGGGVAGGVGGGPSEQRGGRWTERDHELQLSSRRHDPMFTMAGG